MGENFDEMLSEAIEADEILFDIALKKQKIVFADFYAPWCGPCRMMLPIFEEIAKELSSKIVFLKINIDENPELASKLGVMSIPTMKIFFEGKEKENFMGIMPKNILKSKIEKYL